jgi:hypothetical protein
VREVVNIPRASWIGIAGYQWTPQAPHHPALRTPIQVVVRVAEDVDSAAEAAAPVREVWELDEADARPMLMEGGVL